MRPPGERGPAAAPAGSAASRLPARLLAALGAGYCALAVALGAWGAHAAAGDPRRQLELAALYLFLHGVALVATGVRIHSRAGLAAASMLALGSALFAGSLAGAALAGLSTAAAPVGGGLLIGGWLLFAGVLVRGDADPG